MRLSGFLACLIVLGISCTCNAQVSITSPQAGAINPNTDITIAGSVTWDNSKVSLSSVQYTIVETDQTGNMAINTPVPATTNNIPAGTAPPYNFSYKKVMTTPTPAAGQTRYYKVEVLAKFSDGSQALDSESFTVSSPGGGGGGT